MILIKIGQLLKLVQNGKQEQVMINEIRMLRRLPLCVL